MTNLGSCFRLNKTRTEIINEINASAKLSQKFYSWPENEQERFLEICTGNRGLRILYDVYFQEIFNPDTHPERLTGLLSVILETEVESVTYLRRESSLLKDNQNLLVLDIVVKLKDGSIVNVEMQKIGYRFPGQRACCYSSDLVLRQYGAGKKREGKFTYEDMKPVYSIIFIEKSTDKFHEMEENYIHRFTQKSDTGLDLSLLQHYVFVPLDIFRKCIVKKGGEKLTELEAWLLFLSSDDSEDIFRIIKEYPRFEELYRHIFEICQSTERMIDMFSKELSAIDHNTVNYMMDELQEKVKKANSEKNKAEARADKAESTLKEKQEAALRKDEEEIKRMHEDGLSPEKISMYKNKDVAEVKRILGV